MLTPWPVSWPRLPLLVSGSSIALPHTHIAWLSLAMFTLDSPRCLWLCTPFYLQWTISFTIPGNSHVFFLFIFFSLIFLHPSPVSQDVQQSSSFFCVPKHECFRPWRKWNCLLTQTGLARRKATHNDLVNILRADSSSSIHFMNIYSVISKC